MDKNPSLLGLYITIAMRSKELKSLVSSEDLWYHNNRQE